MGLAAPHYTTLHCAALHVLPSRRALSCRAAAPACRRGPTWKMGGMITGLGEEDTSLPAASVRVEGLGEGEAPSTWKPTTCGRSCEVSAACGPAWRAPRLQGLP